MPRALVALCLFDLRIRGVASLKEKRHVLKTLSASLRNTFNVSVAEVDHHYLWQRTAIAVSAVGAQGYHLRKVMQEVERHVERWREVEIIDVDLSLHGSDD
jgi:uncharacterized protein YlxP (DUF503 family)